MTVHPWHFCLDSFTMEGHETCLLVIWFEAIWNNMLVKWDHFPNFRGEHKKWLETNTYRKAWILDSKPCKPNIRSGIFLKRVFFWLVWGSSLDVALKYHFISLKSCQKLWSKKTVIKKNQHVAIAIHSYYYFHTLWCLQCYKCIYDYSPPVF